MQGIPVFERAYGFTRGDDKALPVYRDTQFDLASITKLFTATAALELVAGGSVALDTPLVKWFPTWSGTPHETISLRMLLAHTSGMNSGADFRQLLDCNVLEFALARDLVAPPGEHAIYSDLGFIVLGSLIERVSGKALQSCIGGYAPASTERLAIPATEDDGWRGRVQGIVHDEKAYLMGGVAGHAGLFGTAARVAALAERYLGALHGRPTSLNAAVVHEALREQADDPVLRRALGWALKTSNENSCGRWFSRDSFGHTGFVGTCVWVDPHADVNAVLLTNSVYFGRTDLRDVRAAFYEAVFEDLGLQ
ncbi:MAG: beta-lactamase family protein [Candidatus Eremiobacteraeota bacterium]|nr:beta-lactamase family protein [Candidatus Eremiobacteraeota bacterium]